MEFRNVNTLDVSSFRQRCRAGLSSGVYLLCGPEDYIKHRAVCEAASSASSAFNLRRFSAADEDFSYSQIIDAVTAIPLFAEKKLIEIWGIAPSSMKEGAKKEFTELLDELASYTCEGDDCAVIFFISGEALDCGSEKAPSALLRELSEKATVVWFASETPAKLLGWIKKHFSSCGIISEGNECNALLSRCGTSMYMLSGEIEKITAYILSQGRNRLEMSDIELLVADNIESGAFDFANALLDRDAPRALELLGEMNNRRERPEIILASVSKAFCDMLFIGLLGDNGMNATRISEKTKIHEYRTKLYLGAYRRFGGKKIRLAVTSCYDADKKLKSTPLDNSVLLDTLVCGLLR